jgi:hypothetical protein
LVAVQKTEGASPRQPCSAKCFEDSGFPDIFTSALFLCRATKYSLQAGVRHRRAVEIKKKKLSFETAVTKSLEART